MAKKEKKLLAVNHAELNAWKSELLRKQTHTTIKSGKKCTRMSCCNMHTLFRCGLGTVTYLLVIAALLKYLGVFTLNI